jgi:hypothetical protein
MWHFYKCMKKIISAYTNQALQIGHKSKLIMVCEVEFAFVIIAIF